MFDNISSDILAPFQAEDLVRLELEHLKSILKAEITLSENKTDTLIVNGKVTELDKPFYFPALVLEETDFCHSILKSYFPSNKEASELIKSLIIEHSPVDSIWKNISPELIQLNKLCASDVTMSTYRQDYLVESLGMIIKERLTKFSAEITYITSPSIRLRIIDSIVLLLKEFELRGKNHILSGNHEDSGIVVPDAVCLMIYLFKHPQKKVSANSINEAKQYSYSMIFLEILSQVRLFMEDLVCLKVHPEQSQIIPDSPKQVKDASFKFLGWNKAILLKCYLRKAFMDDRSNGLFSDYDLWYDILTGRSNVNFVSWDLPSTHLIAFLMDLFSATNFTVTNASLNPLVKPLSKSPQWKKMSFIRLDVEDHNEELADVQFIKRTSVSGKDYKTFQLFQTVDDSTSKLIWTRDIPLSKAQTILLNILGINLEEK